MAEGEGEDRTKGREPAGQAVKSAGIRGSKRLIPPATAGFYALLCLVVLGAFHLFAPEGTKLLTKPHVWDFVPFGLVSLFVVYFFSKTLADRRYAGLELPNGPVGLLKLPLYLHLGAMSAALLTFGLFSLFEHVRGHMTAVQAGFCSLAGPALWAFIFGQLLVIWVRRRVASDLGDIANTPWGFGHMLRDRLVPSTMVWGEVGLGLMLLNGHFAARIDIADAVSVAPYWIPAAAFCTTIWFSYGTLSLRPLTKFLKAEVGRRDLGEGLRKAYRTALVYPIASPLVSLLVWNAFGVAVHLPLYRRGVLGVEEFYAAQVGLFMIFLIVTMYQALWLRRTMSPFLRHYAPQILAAGVAEGGWRVTVKLRAFLGAAGLLLAVLAFATYMSELQRIHSLFTNRLDVGLLLGVFVPFSLAVLGLAFLGVKEILDPVALLTEAGQALGRGELDHAIPVQETDEIGMLAWEYEKMRLKLVGKITEVEQLNREMDRKVVERTKELEEKSALLARALEELRETQAMAAHSEKMAALGQLAGGLAHEIKNPINYIKHNVGTLKEYLAGLRRLIEAHEKVDLPSDARQEIERVRREVDYENTVQDLDALVKDVDSGLERTREIIENLRAFSRMERPQDRERMDIHDAIESALQILSPQLRGRITVHRDYQAKEKTYGSPGAIMQVFMNLLQNAEQAVDGKGEIRIETRQSDREVTVAVRDNGRGIPRELQAKVFQAYFTTKERGKGTGIGLAISKRLIEEQGGSIGFSSAPGRGTEFVVRMPIR